MSRERARALRFLFNLSSMAELLIPPLRNDEVDDIYGDNDIHIFFMFIDYSWIR